MRLRQKQNKLASLAWLGWQVTPWEESEGSCSNVVWGMASADATDVEFEAFVFQWCWYQVILSFFLFSPWLHSPS